MADGTALLDHVFRLIDRSSRRLLALGWAFTLVGAILVNGYNTRRENVKAAQEALNAEGIALATIIANSPAARCLWSDLAPDRDECKRLIYGDQKQRSEAQAYAERYIWFLRNAQAFDSIYCDPSAYRFEESDARARIAIMQGDFYKKYPNLKDVAFPVMDLTGVRLCPAQDFASLRGAIATGDDLGIWGYSLRWSHEFETNEEIADQTMIDKFDLAASLRIAEELRASNGVRAAAAEAQTTSAAP